MQDPITGSSNETIKWQPEPALRGTFTIITTCAITLLLCVYSSVHLNLPAINQRRTLVWLRRTAWILGALFAPEYIIFTAQIQRSRAKLLLDEAREAFKSGGSDVQGDAENGAPSRRNPWTLNHSFWALMGGIAIKPSSRNPFIPNSVYSTLTANGVSLLLKTSPHLLPDISVDEVKDKSKASSLTKLLACVQASWFCLSTITRFIQHLPVSMLELNAFAHALCTLAVYILWWHKPLDVSQPVFISADELDPLLAYMWMASKTSKLPAKQVKNPNVSYTVGKDPEFEAILLDGKPRARQPEPDPSESVDLVQLWDGSMESSSAHTPSVTVTTTTSLPGTNFTSNPSSTRWIETRTETSGSGEDAQSYSHHSYTTRHPPTFHLTPRDTHRWRLAHHALTKYNLKKSSKDLDLVTVNAIDENMKWENRESPLRPMWEISILFLLSAAYGGLHALAWHVHFPSKRERLLWRVSSCIVASPIAVIVLTFIIFLFAGLIKATDTVDPEHKEELQRPKSTARKTCGIIWKISKGLTAVLLSGAIVSLYVPARAYLVYESMRTVFFLPPGAFVTPIWTQYLIHVT